MLHLPFLILPLLLITQQAFAEPPEVIECQQNNEFSGRVFTGAEYADPTCIIDNRFVPSMQDNGSAILSVEASSENRSQISVRLNESGTGTWLSSCFIRPDERRVFAGYYQRKLDFLRDRQQITQHCLGRAQNGTLNEYRFQIRLGRVPEAEERVQLVRWKGVPDLARHLINGEYKDGIGLKEGVTHKTVTEQGARFETEGFDPLTLEIRDGFLALIARSDSDPLTLDNSCDFPDIRKVSRGSSIECGPGRKITLIRKLKVEGIIEPDKWLNMNIRVVWSKYEGLQPVTGRVTWFMNQQAVVRWEGDIGRNDHIGPYFTFGASAMNTVRDVDVLYKDVGYRHNLVSYGVNLIRNPNNFGRFSSTWTSKTQTLGSGANRQSTHLHNQVLWGYGGAARGFFATPFYMVGRTQEIDLKDFFDTNRGRRSEKPEIFIGEQFNRTYCGGDQYRLLVRLLDEDRKEIDRWNSNTKKVPGPCQWSDPEWTTVTHTFKNYSQLPRYIEFNDFGKDSEFWAGFYGSRMREATVILRAKGAPVSVQE